MIPAPARVPGEDELRLRRLGDNLAAMLDALWAEHHAGALTLGDFHELGAILTETAYAQAATLPLDLGHGTGTPRV